MRMCLFLSVSERVAGHSALNRLEIVGFLTALRLADVCFSSWTPAAALKSIF